MNNKNIFAANLKRYMNANGKSRRDVCEALGVSYYTFSDWVNGKKYPRMDKVEKLAAYFGIMKSDLIEEKTEEYQKMQKKNDTIAGAVVRMRNDPDFFAVVSKLAELPPEQYDSVKTILSALGKK